MNRSPVRDRSALREARTIVVKVGSAALADSEHLAGHLATQLSALRHAGKQVVLVSSGSVALGWRRLGYRRRPRAQARVRASAAAGQSELMRRYEDAFAIQRVAVAQVLLTHSDLARRESVNHARATLAALLDAGAIPIINENDTVASAGFGDNDQLAAMVMPLVDGDVLILLTNVDGVLDESGGRVSVLRGADGVVQHAAAAATEHGTGGMVAKVGAARKACRCGAQAVIAKASEPDVIGRVLAGEDLGTLFNPMADRLRARKHWIAYTLRPRGTVLVDAGAAAAVAYAQKSLLPIGVLGVRGSFDSGDLVRIVGPDREVGRGLSRLSSTQVARIAGLSRDAGRPDDAGEPFPVLIHKDDLVVHWETDS